MILAWEWGTNWQWRLGEDSFGVVPAGALRIYGDVALTLPEIVSHFCTSSGLLQLAVNEGNFNLCGASWRDAGFKCIRYG